MRSSSHHRRNAISLKFETWLGQQHHRDDYVGAFARGIDVEGVAEKSARRKHNEHASWVEVVIASQEPEYIRTFNEAWQEYLVEKALVDEALEEAASAEAALAEKALKKKADDDSDDDEDDDDDETILEENPEVAEDD